MFSSQTNLLSQNVSLDTWSAVLKTPLSFFSPWNRQQLVHSPNVIKFYFPHKIFTSKRPAGNVECLPGSSTCFLQFLWTRRLQIWLTLWILLPRVQNSFAKSREDAPKMILFEKVTLFQELLWSHGLQFWQLCQNRFAGNPKESHSEPKKNK